jgi:glutaredoxin-like YruB-family protein
MAKNTVKKVVMYTTPTCVYCKMAKEFFKEHGVQFAEYDVLKDLEKRKEMVGKSGQMGVPVITVGDKVFIGFDQMGIADALGL